VVHAWVDPAAVIASDVLGRLEKAREARLSRTVRPRALHLRSAAVDPTQAIPGLWVDCLTFPKAANQFLLATFVPSKVNAENLTLRLK